MLTQHGPECRLGAIMPDSGKNGKYQNFLEDPNVLAAVPMTSGPARKKYKRLWIPALVVLVLLGIGLTTWKLVPRFKSRNSSPTSSSSGAHVVRAHTHVAAVTRVRSRSLFVHLSTQIEYLPHHAQPRQHVSWFRLICHPSTGCMATPHLIT